MNRKIEKSFNYKEKNANDALSFILGAIALFYYSYTYPMVLDLECFVLNPPDSGYLLMSIAVIVFFVSGYRLFIWFNLKRSKENICFYNDVLEFRRVHYLNYQTILIPYDSVAKILEHDIDDPFELKVSLYDGKKYSFKMKRFNYNSEYRDFKAVFKIKVQYFPGIQVNY